MIQLIRMAYRDLLRNKRRSFLSSLALGAGLSLLLMMAAVINGEMITSMEKTLRLESGHVQVRIKDYNQDKASLAWEDLVENPEQVAAQIAAMPEVESASPRLFASGIIATGEHTGGVRIIGIDPAAPASAVYRDGMLNGEFVAADDRNGLLVGSTLAEKFDLNTGDTLNLLVNTSSGEVSEQVFTVRGIYSTGTPGYDVGTVFLPLNKAQAITGADNRASIIFVLLKDRTKAAAVAEALKSDRYEAVTFENMNQLLMAFEDMSNSYMGVLYFIILAITATVIVNTLVMSVFERTREIGILSAIGMKGWRIMTMFFAESSMLAVGGILIGLLLGSLLVAYVHYVGIFVGEFGITGMLFGERIYGTLALKDAVNLSTMAFIITLLAGIYPAVVAANMEPVQALRGGK